jgi:alkylated DNA nucleotide flippase Atl1
MLKKFDDLVQEAETGKKSAIRALQTWIYLIAKAKNRQIVTYKELADLMGYPTANPLSWILGCIMYYCEQNNLPPLTILVVNEKGIPGEGFSTVDLEKYHQAREEVFNYPWYDLVPPSIDEFEEARKKGMGFKA